MTKEEIVKYVMQSPENTNPAVLEGMLNEINGENSIVIVNVNENYISDKSYNEILADIGNEKDVIAHYNDGEHSGYSQIINYKRSGYPAQIRFQYCVDNNKFVRLYTYTLTSENQFSVDYNDYGLLE